MGATSAWVAGKPVDSADSVDLEWAVDTGPGKEMAYIKPAPFALAHPREVRKVKGVNQTGERSSVAGKISGARRHLTGLGASCARGWAYGQKSAMAAYCIATSEDAMPSARQSVMAGPASEYQAGTLPVGILNDVNSLGTQG